MTNGANAIGEHLRARSVRRIAYFHTDHFEPWRDIEGRAPGPQHSIDEVEQFVRASETLEHARRQTLFIKPNLNFAHDPSRELHRAAGDDAIGFIPRRDGEVQASRQLLGTLVGGGHELQVHLHHENFTFNATLRDAATRDYLASPRGRFYDPARVELAVRLILALLRDEGGVPLDPWFFIHGHWALNASDVNECTIVREIELLLRNGCRGDFTQPSGRPLVDARIEEPYLARPIALPKGYDTPEADPIAAAGAGEQGPGRFFHWATALKSPLCSLDTYSKPILQRTADPTTFGLAHAEHGFVHDGTLYVKTHAHSMQPVYWTDEGGGVFPLAHPGVVAELTTLFEAGSAAGAEIAFVTASEVHAELLRAPATSPRRSLIEPYRLREGSQLDGIDTTVAFRTPAGKPTEAPPLLFRAPLVAPPRPLGPPDSGAESAARATIVAQSDVAASGGGDVTEQTAQLAASRFGEGALRVNATAIRVALDRRAAYGEDSGVTGYYVTRAQEGLLLQPAELHVAEFVAERFPAGTQLWEIGCGLGLLATLLADAGYKAIGVERSKGRCDTARAIAAEALHGTPLPEFIDGSFPRASLRRWGLAQSVAIVTNLLGNGDLALQQRFVRGLRRFGTVVIDLQRFYTRRVAPNEIAELLRLFTEEGFDPPRAELDLGSDGHYALFDRADPPPLTARSGWRYPVDRVVGRFAR